MDCVDKVHENQKTHPKQVAEAHRELGFDVLVEKREGHHVVVKALEYGLVEDFEPDQLPLAVRPN